MLWKGQMQTFHRFPDGEITAWDTRKAVSVELVLALPRLQGSYTVDTDALDFLIGSVLLQKQPDATKKAIVYWSSSYNDGKRPYDTKHGERLAVIWEELPLTIYCEGSRFTIRTDHDVLSGS